MADEPTEGTCDELYNQKIPRGRVDYVREEYKRYKRKKPPPDFSEVIDFQDPSTFGERIEKVRVALELNESKYHSKFGLRCVTEWLVYELKTCPGFMFIVNPFLPGAQHYWTRRCMEDFPRKPNVCNLDAHVNLDPKKSVWELSHGNAMTHGGAAGQARSIAMRPPVLNSNDENSDLMDRLRWVHLGYHFDYNVVNYKPERYYDFPSDLACMTQHIANAIGYPDYSPEAGIVNYYPLGGSMGGHTDHYESDLSWPLISLSFGQTAIFLIGGATRDIRPVALYIRSGDIVIMSGKSRTAFHAVPRIVKVGKENEPPPCLKWQDGLFANDVTMTSGANSDETIILDENVKFPDVVEKKTVVSQRTCTSSTARTEKLLFQESCDNKNINKFGNVSSFESECIETSEGCQCNKNNFCSKSMKTLSSDEWRQFEFYLSKTRINVNVRQVHELGKTMNPLVCNVKL